MAGSNECLCKAPLRWGFACLNFLLYIFKNTIICGCLLIVPGHSRRLHSYKTLVLELASAGVDLEQLIPGGKNKPELKLSEGLFFYHYK